MIKHLPLSSDCKCGCPIPNIRNSSFEKVNNCIEITHTLINLPEDLNATIDYFSNRNLQSSLGFASAMFKCSEFKFKLVHNKKELTPGWVQVHSSNKNEYD